MELKDFLPEIELTQSAKKACVEIMKTTGNVPRPADNKETDAIIAWLNHSKKDMPNCMTHIYKDCIFQKRNGKWVLVLRNNDFMYADLLKGKQNG